MTSTGNQWKMPNQQYVVIKNENAGIELSGTFLNGYVILSK